MRKCLGTEKPYQKGEIHVGHVKEHIGTETVISPEAARVQNLTEGESAQEYV